MKKERLQELAGIHLNEASEYVRSGNKYASDLAKMIVAHGKALQSNLLPGSTISLADLVADIKEQFHRKLDKEIQKEVTEK